MIKHGKWSIAIKKRCYSTFTVESVYFKGFESFDPFKMSTKVYKKANKKAKNLFTFVFIAMS